MNHHICVTCGCQYAATERPPENCRICEDERQYVGFDGQRWTTLNEMRRDYRNELELMEPALTRIGTRPSFAIGQHTYLIETPDGNVLWDSITLIDDATIGAIQKRGGISAIAVSHPHYYSSIVEWSHAFDGAPIYVHAADREWVTRTDPAIVYWDEDVLNLGEGLTLIHGGGHFDGAAMLHWAGGGEGRGALLSGDTLQVVYDRRWVSFMYSYPNLIPLPASKVLRLVQVLEPFDFERIYSPWLDRVVSADGKQVVRKSAERYLAAIDD